MLTQIVPILLSVVMICTPFSDISKANVISKGAVVQEIERFFEETDANMQKVKFTYKQILPKKKMHGIIKKVMTFSNRVEKQHTSQVFVNEVDLHKDGQRTEKYSVVSGASGDSFTLIATFEVPFWDEKVWKQFIDWENRLHTLFPNQAIQKFVCVVAETSGILQGNDFLTQLNRLFDYEVNKIQSERQNESTSRLVVYGKTESWADEIIIEEDEINLQAALVTNKQNGTKIIIGTPIVIDEY